jgi:hypothetical protein
MTSISVIFSLAIVNRSALSNRPRGAITMPIAPFTSAGRASRARCPKATAKAYPQAIFQQSQPAAMFFTDNVQADYERLTAHGVEFTMPPTDVTGSRIAMLNDTCGNLIQITQLMR